LRTIASLVKYRVRILVIKKGALGDMIAGTGALTKLREKYPTARIVLLGDKLSETVCPSGTIADEVVDIDLYPRGVRGFFKLLRYVRRQKFDIVANLRWKSDLTAVLTILSGARIKLGGGRGFYTKFYTNYDPQLFADENRHEYKIHIDILKPLGILPENIHTSIHISDADYAWATNFLNKHRLKKNKFLMLTPIASNVQKAWPPLRFTAIAQRFRKKIRAPVLVSYSPGDAVAAENIVRAAAHGVIATGKTTIGQLAALVKSARLVLCNNSGIIHIAYAVGTPVLCLNTSLGWEPCGKRDASITRLATHLPVEQNRHLSNDEVEKLLATISVDEVWSLLSQRWKALA